MTKSADLPSPTEGELAILRVLWERGPSTVRDVHDAMQARGTGYTTVLKLMQIMHDKGLVARDESRRTHVYRPLADRERTQRRLVVDFMDRAFGGSASELVMNALFAKRASREELEAIRAMLDEHEARRKR